MASGLKIRRAIHVAPFKPDRLFLVIMGCAIKKEERHGLELFTTDKTYLYKAYNQDFGPLNIGSLYRYCIKVKSKMQDRTLMFKKIIHYTTLDSAKKANAAYLMASFAVIYLKMPPHQAYDILDPMNQHYLPFRDAGTSHSTFDLTILDCLLAIDKAKKLHFLDFDTFKLFAYDFYNLSANGNLTWIVPDKILAFAGPQRRHSSHCHAPKFYLPFFKSKNITDIVKLNLTPYDHQCFIEEGIQHFDISFEDGSAPSKEITDLFFQIIKKAKGAVAVHCRAGLGRTGTLIAAYLIHKYKFTAPESIAWLRICRPGSIIGLQQKWLIRMEKEFLES